MRKSIVVAVGALVVAGVIGATAVSSLQASVEDGPINVDRSNTAVAGYDAVAYLDHQEPAAGRKALSSAHDGAKYRFASAENLAKFESNPQSYLPQFGGYCAYGVRMGQKLPIDPKAYSVVDGKLYLFLDQATMLTWKEDQMANIQIAEQIWPSLEHTPN